MTPSAAALPESSSSFRLVETHFDDCKGWGDDDLVEALTVFGRSARAIAEGHAPLRAAVPPSDALRRLCQAAVAWPAVMTPAEAHRCFETHFVPHRVDTDRTGFLTGYYEPVIEGSFHPSSDFTAPILRRPTVLERLSPGIADRPFIDRAAIETSVGAPGFEPVVWLRDWVEVFFVHVQGSARVCLPDGERLRLVYDGRNGHAYTSIGRLLVERGEIRAEALSLDAVKRWIREQGQATGEAGRRLMQCNRSYIFFRAEPDAPGQGPIGGCGVPLSPLRSIAVDRTLWPYGLPFFIEADLPWRREAAEPFSRLVIAQDTGSAILGPTRADLFFGSGEAAGRQAGDIRHPARVTVLMPRSCDGAP